MKITATDLPGVLLVETEVLRDERGLFVETYRSERYAAAGLAASFVQDNLSRSVRGTVRGLHLQWPRPQAKLVQVLRGRVFDVVVDVRRGSPSFGRWTALELAEPGQQLFIPPGFAHGFAVLSDEADFFYKTSEPYVAEAQVCVAWDDPDLGIPWPVSQPLLSPRDRAAPRLKDVPSLPGY